MILHCLNSVTFTLTLFPITVTLANQSWMSAVGDLLILNMVMAQWENTPVPTSPVNTITWKMYTLRYFHRMLLFR